MIFRMDTDSVRAMAARFRRTASTMDTSLASIRQSVRSAPWQSQAREEFLQQLEMLHNSTLRSAEVLRMMALAAEQKANQWEAIGNRFNGPWQPMGNAWGQIKSMMGWLWSRIKNAVRGIKLPSVPKYVAPATTGGVVLGASITKPSWLTWPPKWWPPWPFNKKGPDTYYSGGGGGGSGGGSWGGPNENSSESNKISGKEDSSPPPPVTEISKPVQPPAFEKTAEKVPAGTMTYVNYRRGKSKDVKANCTWYAAHAVEVASGGKIKIDSPGYPKLGHARDWANNCMKDPPPPGVTEVDDNAKAGSVFCAGNHVGFVENIFTQDGETYITWSEEGWGRNECPWTGGVRIDVGDDSVYRYRITRPLSWLTSYYQGKGEEIKYIHFNYDNP